MNIRIGLGYDVHRLVENRPLILGGISIPFTKGLDGHSDADALLHAIIDAMLGATCNGDIGTHFPDTEEQFKNSNSTDLLKKVWQNLSQDGWKIINIDTNIIAQKPKLLPHIQAIRNNIATLLSLDNQQVSVKAKTNEKLGYLGREEAIETQAVVLMSK